MISFRDQEAFTKGVGMRDISDFCGWVYND